MELRFGHFDSRDDFGCFGKFEIEDPPPPPPICVCIAQAFHQIRTYIP